MQRDERSLLLGRLMRNRELRFMETLLTIKATLAAGLVAAGQEPGQGLKDLLKDYRNLLFSEDTDELADTAKRHEKMLKQEFAKGPIKIKSQEYSKKKKKR